MMFKKEDKNEPVTYALQDGKQHNLGGWMGGIGLGMLSTTAMLFISANEFDHRLAAAGYFFLMGSVLFLGVGGVLDAADSEIANDNGNAKNTESTKMLRL